MKRIFSIFLTVITVLAAAGCAADIPEVIETVDLGRCLTPTNVTVNVQKGEYIYINADQSKTTEAFVVELFRTESMEGSPVNTVTIPKEKLPFLNHVEADEVYFLRIKAVSEKLSDSKWYVHPKALQTTAIKSSLNPELVDRTSNSITIKWKADPEVDHIRLVPALDPSSKDGYTKLSVTAEEVAAGTKIISGLNPSVKYTSTIHFKSADRGSVSAWTLPDVTGATSVKDTAALKQAIKDGAAKILIPASDTAWVVGEMNLKNPLLLIGELSAKGKRTTVAGRFTISAGATALHCENLSFSGAATGKMSVQTHHVTIASDGAQTISSIGILNCDIDGYQRGLYYDNVGANVGSYTFESTNISNVEGNGGDCFDVRKACTINDIAFTNCTIKNGMRTFMRIDANATVGNVKFTNCTLSNLANIPAYHSNNNGILHIRAAVSSIVFTKNLFLNMKGDSYCQLVGHNTAAKLPTEMSENFFYNCSDEFFTHAIEAVEQFGVEKAIANKGGVLAKDPCVDSSNETFNLVNSDLIAAKIGDPQWLDEYIVVPEDLTLNVTKAVKTWNLTDGKVFYKAADKDMVRDGIRFYVKSNPVLFTAEGLQLTAAATLKEGVPTDCGMGIKVDQPGSIVVSATGGDQTLLVVSLDGKVKAGIPAGAANAKVVLADIPAGEEHMVYIYGTDAVAVTSLQWSDDVDAGGDKKLATPAAAIDKTEVVEGTETDITVTWDAVAKAGSYDAVLDGKATNVTELKYVIAAKSLAAGLHKVGVVALPAKTDLTREHSDTAWVSFTVKEVLKPVNAAVPTVWDAAYMTAGIAAYGTGDLTADFIYGNLGYVAGGGKFKFGTDNADDPAKAVNRVQLGGTGTAGTKSNIQFIAGGAGTLEIVARSSGDASTERPLAVAIGSSKVASYVTVDKSKDPAKYTYDCSAAAAGDKINIYSEKSGINIYSITWTPKQNAGPVVDETAISAEYMSDYTNTTVFPASTYTSDVTIEKVTYYATSDKTVKWASNRFQFGGKPNYDTTTYPGVTMPTTARYASFKITKPGTVSIQFYSGGSSNTGRNGTVVLETNVGGVKSAKTVLSNDSVSCSSSDAAALQTITITAEDLAGITEAAKLYFFSTNNTIQIIKIGFKPAE